MTYFGMSAKTLFLHPIFQSQKVSAPIHIEINCFQADVRDRLSYYFGSFVPVRR